MSRKVSLHLIIAAVSFCAVAVAKVLQSVWHLEPCTMCILQRYAFVVIGSFAVFRALTPARAGAVIRAGISLAGLAGLLASLRIQWAISVPSASCGRDKIAAFLNSLPWVDAWPAMFEATGVCGDPVPPVMGLPFHIWSLMLFTVVILLAWVPARRTRAVAHLER